MLINALTASLLPVSNAIFIVMIVVAIYAVLGVSFFRADDPDRFRTFAQSVFTMFQVLLATSLANLSLCWVCSPGFCPAPYKLEVSASMDGESPRGSIERSFAAPCFLNITHLLPEALHPTHYTSQLCA